MVRMQSFENPKLTDKDIKEITKKSGLNIDKKALDALGYLLDFGFENQFEIQLPFLNYLFSSNIKREYFKRKRRIIS